MDRREESRQGQHSSASRRSPRREAASAGARHRQSDVRAPGNRLPQVYYQRRRAAAVVALVVVVLLVAWALSAIGGNSNNTATPVASTAASSEAVLPSTSASATSSIAPAEDPGAGVPPAAAATSEPSTAVAASESQVPAANLPVCDINQLVMTASTDHPTYAAGALPVFYMAVKNTSPVDCVINVDDNPLRFEVYDLATNQRVWSDVDCNTAVKTGEQQFKAGEEIYFQAKWSRTSSAPGKCTQRSSVAAADYYLHTVIGNNASEPATFSLK